MLFRGHKARLHQSPYCRIHRHFPLRFRWRRIRYGRWRGAGGVDVRGGGTRVCGGSDDLRWTHLRRTSQPGSHYRTPFRWTHHRRTIPLVLDFPTPRFFLRLFPPQLSHRRIVISGNTGAHASKWSWIRARNSVGDTSNLLPLIHSVRNNGRSQKGFPRWLRSTPHWAGSGSQHHGWWTLLRSFHEPSKIIRSCFGCWCLD
ncbi:hypothetical protein LINGRAPRIM_LOCUS2235 [Linum grandiflorum]